MPCPRLFGTKGADDVGISLYDFGGGARTAILRSRQSLGSLANSLKGQRVSRSGKVYVPTSSKPVLRRFLVGSSSKAINRVAKSNSERFFRPIMVISGGVFLGLRL